jgi:hypothetical protein
MVRSDRYEPKEEAVPTAEISTRDANIFRVECFELCCNTILTERKMMGFDVQHVTISISKTRSCVLVALRLEIVLSRLFGSQNPRS